jgi:DNA-binding transcriptional LysR family regulator
MDLNRLSLFVAVADASSFTVAAERLGVRRSSVSRGIASLERSLGVQLFSRTTRHVALSTAGAALYARLSPLLAKVHEAVGALPEREAVPSGDLRLTAPNDLGSVFLPAALASFSLRYPAVHLDVRLTNRRVDLVAEGFDLALRISRGRLADSTLVARRLSELDMHVVAAPAYLARAGTPRTVEDATTHPWLYLQGTSLPPPLVAPAAVAPVVADDIMFLYGAVKAGFGLGLLPTWLTRDDLATGHLARVLPRVSVGAGAVYLVHPATRHLPRKVTAFRDHLIEWVRVHPLLARG